MNKIISCIIVDDEPVAREVLEELLAGIPPVKIIATCRNAMEAFSVISEKRIDLVFLDINMPGISGLSFAKSINREIKIIFTTAYREYAVEGFDLRAVDYLLKPISFERLLQSVNKYLDENSAGLAAKKTESENEKSNHIFVKSERKMVKICFDEVKYIESVGDYIRIWLNDRSVVTRESISSIEARVPRDEFIRTHRSFIVSVNGIDSFTSEYVEIGKNQIPVSRSYRDDVLRRLG
ncbi:MAG: response regulator transcription factor [Bacteroidia bacterium]|nr:MAG: response regulator transcription factor [Bacteroidia bacterium]